MLHAAHIVTQPEYMVSKLVNYMEKDCPSQPDGQKLREEIENKIEKDPSFFHNLNLGIIARYADKINKLCDQHELEQSSS